MEVFTMDVNIKNIGSIYDGFVSKHIWANNQAMRCEITLFHLFIHDKYVNLNSLQSNRHSTIQSTATENIWSRTLAL